MLYEPMLDVEEIRVVAAIIKGLKGQPDDVRWEAALMGMDYLITARKEQGYAAF